MKLKYGIFGGTFDPPHLGHLILAAEALHQLSLDRLLWILTPDPPHKWGQYVSPLPIRLKLVQAALADAPEFELSTIDIDRPSPHYAVDTVNLLQLEYPDIDMIYLMGGDSLQDLHNWYQPERFISSCAGLGVMRRPGDHINITRIGKLFPGINSKIQFVEAPLLEIASYQIRNRIANKAPYRYYLHPEVFKIILEERLYL